MGGRVAAVVGVVVAVARFVVVVAAVAVVAVGRTAAVAADFAVAQIQTAKAAYFGVGHQSLAEAAGKCASRIALQLLGYASRKVLL